jgi:hypothetical protein
MTKTQRKNARRRAKANEVVSRPVHTAYLRGDAKLVKGEMALKLSKFPTLDQNAATWVVHTARVKYIDSAAAPDGIVKLVCGGKTVADQAGKSPQLWINVPTARIAADQAALQVGVERDSEGGFALEVTITATTFTV